MMKTTRLNLTKAIKTLFILTLICICTNAAFAQKTEYFRHLVFRETPYSDTRGIYQIDHSTAQKEAHYKFVYDDQNRPIEVSHRIGDFIINDNGNWDSFIWFSPKMTIEYTETQEIRYYYNRLDNRIEAHGKMYKAVFDLDENGNRTSLSFYDKEGNPSQNAWNIHTYQWRHLGEGKVIEKRFNLKNEAQPQRPDLTFYTTRMEFGNDDLLDFIYHLDENGDLINNSMKAAADRIVYDNHGNFSRWMVFDKDLKPAEGNAPELAIGEHLYDNKGNKVELRGFDVAGKSKAMPLGEARTLNSYDSFNNQVEVKLLDINDNVIEHMKREYSADGHRVEWIKFFDNEGKLTVPTEVGFAALKIEYAEDGSMKGQKRFDANLKEMK